MHDKIILEQEGVYNFENAPTPENFNPKLDLSKPKPKTAEKIKDKIKNTAQRAAIAADGTAQEVERLFTSGLNKDTKREINKHWLPYYFRTGNFRIKGKNQKSFYVDLRLIGFIEPEVRNYFLKQSKNYKSKGPTAQRFFMILNLLAAYMPRSEEAAKKLPKNARDIKPSHPWRMQAAKKLERDRKNKQSWFQKTLKDLKNFPGTFYDEIIQGNGALEIIRKAKEAVKGSLKQMTKEHTQMKEEDIRGLIKEAFTDKVYGQYPYSHKAGDESEPKEDYVEEWKRFCVGMVQDKSKEKAIAIAKILIKDIELFEDVLDIAGQNQSIGSEILRKMEESNKNIA